jgi:signal transduction histidine kinase
MLQPGTLLHALPLPVAVFDRDRRFLSGNEAWRVMLLAEELPPAQPGTPFFDLFPETEQTLAPLIERALAGESVAANGLRLMLNQRTYFWDIAIIPVPDATAEAGFVCAITDVTEQMLAKQLLTRRVADRTRKLSALYAILEAAAHSEDLHHVGAIALNLGIAATHADGGVVLLADDAAAGLQILAVSGLTPEVAAALSAQPHGNALAKESYRTIQADIVVRSQIQGHIRLLRRARRPFGEEDQALLSSMADQLGVVIERSLLQLETERLIVLQERNRLARELHDAVTQSLYSLTLFAEASRRLAQSGDIANAEKTMARVSDTARQALREMRLLVHNLRPSALKNAGLEQALRQRLDAVERRAGISAQIAVNGPLDLPAYVEEALYQIAQEALNNSLKHAAAGSVHVLLDQQKTNVLLAVRDDGRGFDPLTVDSGGVGLASMRERAALLNGTLQITRPPQGGAEVTIRLDLRHIAQPAGARGLQTMLNRSTP